MAVNDAPARRERGASAVAYALLLAVFAIGTGSIAQSVADSAGGDLEDRGSRIGNPDQFAATVVSPGDDGSSGGDDESTPPTASTSVAISDMVGEASPGSGNEWTASVTVSVSTVAGSLPVGGAVVNGVWSHNIAPTSCSTDASGSCVVSQTDLRMVGKKKVDETTLTILDVEGLDLVYEPDSDHPSPPEVTVERP